LKKMARSRSTTPAGASILKTLGYAGVGRQRRSGLDRGLFAISTALLLAVLAALTVGGPSAQAAFPGTNGKVFCPDDPFAAPNNDTEIFSANPDGTERTQLTDNAVPDAGPAISPNGSRVAFQSRPVGQNTVEIYVTPNDGNLLDGAQRLTFHPNGAVSPTWSPDGSQIAFHAARPVPFPDGTPPTANDIEIYKVSSTVGEDITPATRLTVNRGQDAIPSWSPDGTKSAWQRLYQGTNPLTDPLRSQNLEVWTMNPDGTGATNITNSPGTANDPLTPFNENTNGLDRDAIWSPDSKQIAFSSTRTSTTPNVQNFEVWRMNRDGSEQTRLTADADGPGPGAGSGDFDAPLTYSPDGTQILFNTDYLSTPGTFRDVAHTMSAVTGEPTGITPVTDTVLFARCDWQALQPGGVPTAVPVPGGTVVSGTTTTTGPSPPTGGDRPGAPLVETGGSDTQKLGSQVVLDATTDEQATLDADGTIAAPRRWQISPPRRARPRRSACPASGSMPQPARRSR